MKKEIAVEIIVFLFVILFLYAAGTKLLDYERSVAQIAQSPLLTKMSGFIAWFVPIVEIIVSVMLMVPVLRLTGLYAAFGLMLTFTFYIIAILSFSKELPCACGGVLSMLHWKGHLVFNIVFVILAFTGILLSPRQSTSKTTIA